MRLALILRFMVNVTISGAGFYANHPGRLDEAQASLGKQGRLWRGGIKSFEMATT